MAYTYEDFINAATKAGMMDRFDETDLQTAQKSPEYGLSLLSLMGDMDNAQTEEQRLLAGEAAKQLRTSYGTQKADPTGFVYSRQDEYDQLLDRVTNPEKYQGEFVYSKQDQYDQLLDRVTNPDKYQGEFVYSKQDQYDQMLDKVTNPGQFQYEVETDPVYAALKKVYLEGGDKATRDTLARASAGTGGQANSYAIAAAQQAGAEYAAGLAKEIPGLVSDAYQKHLNQLSADQAAFAQLKGDMDSEREQYLQALANALGVDQAAFAQLQNDREIEREQYQQALANALGVDQATFAQLQNDRELEKNQFLQAYENAMGLYQVLGYATPEIAQILGIPESAPQVTIPAVGSGNQPTGNPNLTPVIEVDQEALQRQQMLKDAGYEVNVDGVWTSAMDAQWNAYQKANYKAVLDKINAEKGKTNAYQQLMQKIKETAEWGYITQEQRKMLEDYCKQQLNPNSQVANNTRSVIVKKPLPNANIVKAVLK